MKSVLCTSLPFVNANGDAFESDDLVEAVESGQMDKLQPAIVDWRHDFQSCGNTIHAEVNDKMLEIEGFGKNKVKQITVYSVFYAWLNTYKAKKIRENVKDPDPYYRGTFKSSFSSLNSPFDNIFTFLICNKLHLLELMTIQIYFANIESSCHLPRLEPCFVSPTVNISLTILLKLGDGRLFPDLEFFIMVFA